MKVRTFHAAPNIPERISHLHDLAMNLWFCWNWEAVRLFIRLDPKLWEECYQNPVEMLGRLSQKDFDEAAQDESFVADLERVYEHFQDYINRQNWYTKKHGDKQGFLTAYFSCEYGIDEGLPIYSGGLGILSGDHLKSASDLGLPLVGIGLLYQKGYFRQRLNLDGWQEEAYPINDWYNMPVTLLRDGNSDPLKISLDIAGDEMHLQIWKVQVGRVPLYLLDSNIPENSPQHRDITDQLYGGDRDMRMRQELVLGIGGIRALDALGLSPTVYHVNEGHSAFLALERIRKLVTDEALTFQQAREVVQASTVFTTHTPVPAGNEVFDIDMVKKYLAPHAIGMGLSWQDFAALGAADKTTQDHKTFSMPALALRLSAFANGVSKLHGAVSREMWKGLWPDLIEDQVPITSVTNGIHTCSWLSHDLADLFERYFPPRFKESPEDPEVWENIDDIPDSELWRVHQARRERLVFFVRKRLSRQLARQGAGSSAMKMAEEALQPEALTLGFARRFATYKRATLLLKDPERLKRLLTHPERPVQILFAGKAHPQDTEGKELIKSVIHFARRPDVRNRVVFLEDYDINVARYLVQGVDVWINTPVRPMEASGTSGMKAAANGVLNLSITDGWWAEGYNQDVGWSLGGGTDVCDPKERDRVESEALYNILEREVVPLFYDHDRTALPRGWIKMMKDCFKSLGWRFSAHRMVREYAERAYFSAHDATLKLRADTFAKAKETAAWRSKLAEAWPEITLETQSELPKTTILVGDTIPLKVRAHLGSLTPEDVRIEAVYGLIDPYGKITHLETITMQQQVNDDGWITYFAEFPCKQSGQYGFAVRAVPNCECVTVPCAPSLVTWE
ncbi:MAG: alpha-glucan family phosphorylase [Planctomycetes bacterium]|nr:alpha-glucan family phosphorylase [Planctomycetota bacterium]